MDTATLKARFKASDDAHGEPTRIRLHRAISWLGRAEAASREDDPDVSFILLWIAFNAAYAQEFGFEQRERDQLRSFIDRLVAADTAKVLHGLLFSQFTGPVRTLVDNRFVFEPFWKALREHDASGRWEQLFADRKKQALDAMMSGRTGDLLAIVLDRLYVLRNQLVHGGATWNSQLNRQQVGDGARLLGSLVPAIIGLMLDHPELDYGAIAYPVVPG
jgi:hypothetical protein